MIKVNEKECTSCGICVDVCPVGSLKMGGKYPEVNVEFCIACGHCVAVCPESAIDNVNSPLSSHVPLDKIPVIDEKTAEHFLRSRRSIRHYKEKDVTKEKITKLLDVARLAPTGSNFQGISFKVILDKDILDNISKAVIKWMKNAEDAPPQLQRYFSFILNRPPENQKKMILRNAPALIIAVSADKNHRDRDNACFMLAYAELFAPSLGLGTCWAGFVDMCAFSGGKELIKALDLPECKHYAGAIMAGYPKYEYKRLPNRKPLEVDFI